MSITRCENGHFYDGDKYERCPQCGPVGENMKYMENGDEPD